MPRLPPVLHFRVPAYRHSSDLLHLADMALHSHTTVSRDEAFAVFRLMSCAENDGTVTGYTDWGYPCLLRRAFDVSRSGIGYDAARQVTSDSTPSWAPDWMDTPFLRRWLVLAEMHRESTLGMYPAGLPVNVSLVAGFLRFRVFRLGMLSCMIDEHTGYKATIIMPPARSGSDRTGVGC